MSEDRADTEAIPAVTENPDADPGRRLAWLVVGQCLVALSLIPWWSVAITVTAATADSGMVSWIFAGVVWLIPAWPVGFSIAAWVYWSRERSLWAGVLITVALVPAVLMVLLFALSAA